MIGQGLGLAHLIPRALALLAVDPLAEGDNCPGDLLLSVLESEQQFWEQQPELLAKAISVAEIALARMDGEFRKDYEEEHSRVQRALDILRSRQARER